MSLIEALLRQKSHEFKANLHYKDRPCHKQQQNAKELLQALIMGVRRQFPSLMDCVFREKKWERTSKKNAP